MSKRSRKAQVWIACRVPDKREPLLLLFKVIESRAGGWHPVTGGVEEDEDFLEGAKREVLEETGFKEKMGLWVDLEYEFSFEGRWGKAKEKAFGFILEKGPKDPVLDPKEHLAFEWVTLSEAKKKIKFENQLEALERFRVTLSGS